MIRRRGDRSVVVHAVNVHAHAAGQITARICAAAEPGLAQRVALTIWRPAGNRLGAEFFIRQSD